MKKATILEKNYINYKNITEEDLKVLINDKAIFFFDTESCPVMPQSIVDKYNLTNIDYSTLGEFKSMEEGSLLYILKENKELKAKIYVWQFGCNKTDKVYYGNTIEEFFNFIQTIDTYKVNQGKKTTPYTTFIHNIQWDLEFIKYYLKDNDFTQELLNKDKKKSKTPKTFDITETSDGVIHNATITLDSCKAGRKKVLSTIVFRDSMKITPLPLEKIGRELIEVDEIYLKNSDVYNYNLIRDEKTYIPNEVEGWYQYCDIYLLKEWYNQFVELNYIEYGIKPYTISQIAFDSVLDISYHEDKQEGKYDYLEDKKGNISNRKIYEEHFALNFIENRQDIAECIRDSYKGGITTVSKKYRDLANNDNNNIECVSLDITSSYPSVCINKPLPYGVPTDFIEGKYKDLTILDEVYDFHFITIGFDAWYSKNPNNQFGLPIKVKNLKDSEKQALGYTPNELYTTNMIGFNAVGNNRPEILDIERRERINKLPYRYIVTLTHVEYECWIRMFNFFRFEDTGIEEGVHFIDYISFKSEIGYFAEGLNHYFEKKNEGSRTGNKAMEYNAKILINSFYGKHGSKRNRVSRKYDLDSDIIKVETTNESNRNEWVDDKKYAVHYASAVTSWGRVNLMDTVNKLDCERFVYSDTDSIKIADMTKEELIKKCKENNIPLSLRKEDKVLGGWDYEGSYSNFKAIAQKRYCYIDKKDNSFNVKCSGLPKNVTNTIKDKTEFFIGSSFIKLGKSKVIGGNLLLPTEFTINDLTLL